MKENNLWSALRTAAKGHDVKLTRIETGDTAIGVSDVEYVSPWRNGWVELKTTRSHNVSKPLVLAHEFSLQQLAWLVAHNNPARNLVSWLCVGVQKAGKWNQFLLLRPVHAACLLPSRPPISISDLCCMGGVVRCFTARDVVCTIAGRS